METLAPTTSHVELKRKMLDSSLRKHQSVIDDFQTNIKDLLASEGNINEEEFDLSQQEFNTETLQQVIRIADQVKFANDEMVLLYNRQSTIETIHQDVQLGAAVVTDKDIFFVSVSIERFEVDGLPVFGLSTESPLFKVMEGKKSGDSFTFGKNTYRIKDVFGGIPPHSRPRGCRFAAGIHLRQTIPMRFASFGDWAFWRARTSEAFDYPENDSVRLLAEVIDRMAPELVHPFEAKFELDARVVRFHGMSADAHCGGDLESAFALAEHVIHLLLLGTQRCGGVAGVRSREPLGQRRGGPGTDEPTARADLVNGFCEHAAELRLGYIPQSSGGKGAFDLYCKSLCIE